MKISTHGLGKRLFQEKIIPYIHDYLKEDSIPSSAKNGSIIPGLLTGHYHFAVQYLMKIQDISVKTGKTPEFSEYLHNIKTEHARKKRFIQELSVLEGRTILEDM